MTLPFNSTVSGISVILASTVRKPVALDILGYKQTAIGKSSCRNRSHGSFTYGRMGVRFLTMVFTAVGHGIP